MFAPLLLLVALGAQDSIQVRSRLNDPEIRAGETTVLRVDVETQGERARIGTFTTLPPGIELVGTRDFDQRQFSLPGGVRRFVSREFVLRARAAGQYRIPSLDIMVAGQTYTTSSRLLTVAAAPSPEGGETRGNADGVFLRAWLDKDTAYVGEQVTLEVEALFSQDARLRLRRAPQYEPPSPSGFWIHEIPDGGRPQARMMNGEMYEAQTFRRAFFPLAEGRYTIPAATLEYEMRRGLLYAPETHQVEGPELPLVVLDVPEEGRPADYTGAVGDLGVRGWLEPERVPAGEAAVLTVEVVGEGNVKALPPPRLPDLPDVEVFPPTEEAESETAAGRVQGRKRFSWVLIPREPGERVIPPIRYAFFDPDAARFETAEVTPMTLTVEPGATTADDAPAPTTLRYLKTAPSRPDPLAFVRTPWFAAAQALPLLILAGALVRLRSRERRRGVSRSGLRRRRLVGIRALEARLGEGDTRLFSDAEAFARSWLGARLGLSEREAGDAASLVSVGVREDTASSLVGLLQRLAAARYAPAPPGPEARRDLVRALGRLLERVDREAQPPRRTGGAPLLLVVVGLLGGGAPAAAHGEAAQAPEAFAEGVRLFDAGRPLQAAAAFQRHVEARPADPAGWYNLGTAYHHAGEVGRAAWAWLHVPRLDPRDGDVRHNLRVAGVRPELVARVAPTVPLRPEEAALLASVAWLIVGVAGALWILRRRSGAAATAVIALVVMMAAAAAAWDSTRGVETVIVLDDSVLRAAPNLRAESVAALTPGSGLVPVARQGEWVRARTLRGEEGWIEARETGSL